MNRDTVLAAAHTMLGPGFHVVTWHTGHLGTPVLRARTGEHGEVIVKAHRDQQRHEQETRAYREWVPVLGGLAPQLIAVTTTPPAIAISAVAGEPIVGQRLSCPQQHDAFAQAGMILHRFHQAAAPQHDPQWREFLTDRGHHWIRVAGDHLPTAVRHELTTRIDALAGLPNSPLTPCHLDFMPRNLLRDQEGTVRVVDFEHARYDLPARDLVRITRRVFNVRFDLRDAFLDGYGPLDELDHRIIEYCAAIDHASLIASTLHVSG